MSPRKVYRWSSVAEKVTTRSTNYDAREILFGWPGGAIRVGYARCELGSADLFQGLVSFSGEHGTGPLGSKKD